MSLKNTAQEVLEIVDRGFYEVDDVRVSLESVSPTSVDSSRLYTPGKLEGARKERSSGNAPTIRVISATTQVAAQQLASSGPVVLLNFASARNPGGGFLNGAKAQEEDLCRCSNLYPTLLQHPQYYEANRAQGSLLYTDHAIFSPNVVFFKTRGTGDLLAQPFIASVITAPAPNSRPYLRRFGDPLKLRECFERRWRNVLAIARAESYNTILLGAWGCGAFGGDPVLASRTAKRALDDFGPSFDKVVFAIPGKGRQSEHNMTTFSEQLGGG